MATNIARLKSLPGVWRVNGYSNLKLSENRVPRVFISMSQIHEGWIHNPLHTVATTGKQMWLNQPLSRVSDLLIGSCWRGGESGGGRRVNTLPALQRTYTVDTSRIQIVSLAEEIQLNGHKFPHVLPPWAIQVSQHFSQLKHGLYAIVPVLSDTETEFLVVSCYELYRAYMGVSSRFMNNLAFCDLSQYMEWRDDMLVLKTPLNLLERFVAFRGHCSPMGRKWFNSPANYLRYLAAANAAQSTDKQSPFVIRALFPFSGVTTLTIAGKPFKQINQEGDFVQCVYAANLLRCNKQADFIPKIGFSTFSKNPLPWSKDDIGNQKPPNDDTDDETEDSDEQPNVGGRGIALLWNSNFFAAMEGLPFVNIPLDEKDPVYENKRGQPFDTTSQDNVDNGNDDGKPNPQESRYDEHVDTVVRHLSTFIDTIIALRALVIKRGWIVRTRRYVSSIVLNGEQVTTFLNSRNKRRKWHLIEDDGRDRLRQIAWVEIEVSNGQFVYLMEMEIRGSESGRSTRVLWRKDLGYMQDNHFKTFLIMTAQQNKWPTPGFKWPNSTQKERGDAFFSLFGYCGISHPVRAKKKTDDESVFVTGWASRLESKLVELLEQ